ncbi:phosphotransferase [Helicobacter trogontum]|uniref:phosphotransferase n=1 Tax=Helicobacter trogontum TaxID=50960 RepID=UPI000CF0EA77|nr:phosphotransferase [Helicobacter trogontum]
MVEQSLAYDSTEDIYIYISGHSGCRLEVIDDQTILKTTANIDYMVRLKKQCEKQMLFAKIYENHDKVLIPRVLHQYWKTTTVGDGNEFGFSMPYYYANDCVTFFENTTIANINQTIHVLSCFVENNIKDSVYTTINKEIFYDKYKEVAAKIIGRPNKDLNVCLDSMQQDLSQLPNKIILPIGRCHGDLTFSNILFTNDKIILIDFLDNFIETPLQDIVKLRQDTRYKWSLMLYRRDYDKTKITMILDYLDEIIDTYFAQYEFYRKYYTIFQKINLFRILPYVKENYIFDYVMGEIIHLNIKRI